MERRDETMRPKMTRELARAAAMDAANSQMRKAGRKAWSLEDRNKAVRVCDELWPIEELGEDT